MEERHVLEQGSRDLELEAALMAYAFATIFQVSELALWECISSKFVYGTVVVQVNLMKFVECRGGNMVDFQNAVI